MASPNVTGIQCEGAEIRDWTKVTVARSLMQASGSFEITIAKSSPTFLKPGASVLIWRGRTRVAAGYVDTLSHSIKDGQAQRVFTGRDATADLADCCIDVDIPNSEIKSKRSWKNSTATIIARQILQPFGLKVLSFGSAAEKMIPFLSSAPGETCFEVIERAMRLSGVICYPDNGTRLAIGTPGGNRVEEQLVFGRNITELELGHSMHNRYSKVVVVGQSSGNDDAFASLVSDVSGVAYDDDVPRPRPLLVLAETGVTPGLAQSRADWEVAVRKARSIELAVSVKGWERAGDGGDLWNLNQVVRVVVAPMLIDSDFLVAGVRFDQSDRGGSTCELSLVAPDAYLPEPLAAKAKQGNPILEYLSQTPDVGTDVSDRSGPEDDPDAVEDGEEER